MIIYLGTDFRCHVTDDGTRRALDVPFFDGRCTEFIEGYRYVPSGETWTRDDGETFTGEMVAPWRNYSELSAIQSAVDRTQAQADEEIGILLDTIEELIIGG